MPKREWKNQHASRAGRGGPVVDEGAASTTAGSLAAGEGVYRSLDPLDPRRVSLDIFEAYCQEMLATKSVARRAYLITKMRYMIQRLIRDQLPYGRLFNRTMIANIIARVFARHPYVIPDEIEREGQLADCLVDLSPDKWSKIADQFKSLRESMLRNDAALLVLPFELDNKDKTVDHPEEMIPEEDDSINEALESHVDFEANYEVMMDRVKFHQCLSHLQPQLATAIRSSRIVGAESVVIPHDNIIAFEAAIDEQFGDAGNNKYRRILQSLLEGKKQVDRTTRRQALNLKPYHVIESIHLTDSPIFDLKRFQDDLLSLISRWTHMVLPFPALSKFNYGSARHGDMGEEESIAGVDDKENANRKVNDVLKPSPFATSTMDRQHLNRRQKIRETGHLSPIVSDNLFDIEVEDDIESSSENETGHNRRNLKRKMKKLMHNVKDPLNECVAIARSARADQYLGQTQGDDDSSSEDEAGEKPVKKIPPLCQKRKTAYQIKFDDSDDSEGEAVALSEVPARYEHAKSFQAFPEIHVQPHPPKKRKKFTAEEDGAIREGIRQFGAGHWAQIKANFAIVLKDRDAVAIKDRWRTINKET